MLRFTLAALAACLLVTPALAQGYPEPYGAYWQRGGEEPWYGYYIGVQGGGAFGDLDFSSSRFSDAAFPSAIRFSDGGKGDSDGGLIGGTIGSQLQAGGFVFGVEADIGYADASSSETIVAVDPFNFDPLSSAEFTADAELNFFGTVRVRAGYAYNRLLVFATGGWAFADIDTSVSATYGDFFGSSSAHFDDSNFHSGWTVGGGAEFMLTPHITAKAEYLFADLGTESYSAGGKSGTGASVDVDYQTSIVRGGLNYKF